MIIVLIVVVVVEVVVELDGHIVIPIVLLILILVIHEGCLVLVSSPITPFILIIIYLLIGPSIAKSDHIHISPILDILRNVHDRQFNHIAVIVLVVVAESALLMLYF